MPAAFPGMNPYLEHPDRWHELHQELIYALAEDLRRKLLEPYQVVIKSQNYRVSGEDALMVGIVEAVSVRRPDTAALDSPATDDSYYDGLPAVECSQPERPFQPIDVLVPVPQEVAELSLEIVDLNTQNPVTRVEILSPAKKRAGRGRQVYEHYREAIIASSTHLVEIDLLRSWEPTVIYNPYGDSDYRILVSRSEQRPKAALYTWDVQEPIPVFPLPLQGTDGSIEIDLKQLLDRVCDRASFDSQIDYQRDPLPPLPPDSNSWLDGFLQQSGRRT